MLPSPNLDLIPGAFVRRLGDGVHRTAGHGHVRLRGMGREHFRTGKWRRENKPEGFMEMLSLVREYRSVAALVRIKKCQAVAPAGDAVRHRFGLPPLPDSCTVTKRKGGGGIRGENGDADGCA